MTRSTINSRSIEGIHSIDATGTVTAAGLTVDTDTLHIDSTNNHVGIGTSSPSRQLHINNASESNIRLQGGSDYAELRVKDADNAFSFHFGGSEYMRIDSSGKVGIGASSPATGLHITGSDNLSSSLTLQNTAPSPDNIWRITPLYNSGDLAFFDDGTERMRITSAGNVGIGTSNPGKSLEVAAFGGAPGIRLRRTDITNSDVDLLTGGGSTGKDFLINVNQSEAMRISADGNVGIGTASPQKPLDVVSDANDFVTVGALGLGINEWTGIHFGYRENNANYRKSAIVFERTDLTASDGQGKIHILNGPQGSGGSATLADAKITIAENGSVGIGATSPSSLLHVYGTNPVIRVDNSPSTGAFGYAFYRGATKNADITWNEGDANLKIKNYRNDANVIYGNIDFHTGGTSSSTAPDLRMRITTDGNVGIGTTSPGNKLHVSGSFKVEDGASSMLFQEYNNGATIWLDGADGDFSGGDYYGIHANNTGGFGIGYAGASTFNINSSGNVGIKNSNPTVPLDVTTAGGGNWVAQFQNTTTATSYGVNISEPSGATAGYPLLRVGQGFSPYTDFLRVNTNGNSAFGGGPSSVARVNILGSQDKAGLLMKRTFYNWFEWGGNPGGAYLHIKTGLYAGGGATGNIAYTMSLFEIKGYTYNAETIDTMIGFHNWSGSYSQLVIQNKGTRAAGSNPYTSSDGYVVLVVNTGTNYPGITINWHQAFPYSFRDVGVTAYSSSSSSGGVY